MDCKQVGWAVQRLGAGREKVGDPVAAHAGIEMHSKIGTLLKEGDPVCTLFSEDAALLAEPERLLRETIRIEDAPPTSIPLIRKIITVDDIGS
jgi:pyrimidine-nucleoside phosphorylase